MTYRLAAWLAALVCLASAAGAEARAAAPEIRNLSLRGLTSGGTTSLVISGANLLPEPRLVMSVPIAAQRVRAGGKPNQVTIDVTLDASVPSGIYQLWVATGEGVSAPAAVAVDPLAQLAFAPEIESLPVALSGTLQGSGVLRTSFAGRAGQRIVVDLESRRLGGRLNGVLHLYDSRNVQLAWAQRSGAIYGDARLETVLPADGRYSVELHDALYRGAAPGFFRLKIGDLRYVDLVFPLAVRRVTSASVELIPAPAIDAAWADVVGQAPLPHAPLVGARPRVIASDLEEVIERPRGEGLQQVRVPAAINGRLSTRGEEDRYELLVSEGQRLRFDLLSERAGGALDGVLRIEDEKGAQLASSDDRPGTTDPGLDFTVPKGTSKLVAAISDLNGLGGEYSIYRLSITPVGQPDFSLEILDDRLRLPGEGLTVLHVRATRSGYSGAIRLEFDGLPAGTRVSGEEIPAGATDTLVSLGIDRAELEAGIVSVVGRGVGGGASIERAALVTETPASGYQPWMRRELVGAVVKPSAIAAGWDAVSADPTLPLGSNLAVRVSVDRRGKAVGAVRLTLLTSQPMPQKKIPGKVIRGNQREPDKLVDDVERAIRFESEAVVPADKSTLEARVLVPGDLAGTVYDLAVKAELLSADGKSVAATAWTEVWRLRTSQPFTLELDVAKVEAKAGLGPPGSIAGRIVRMSDFDLPVTVSLEGLPGELPVAMVEVPAGQSEFVLPVAFPYPTALGELKNVRLLGASRVSDTVTVRSLGVPVEVRVVRGEAPPPLLPLFEDEPQFVNYLTEGDGKATLETADVYSGRAALRVTGQQAYRTKMPGLGYKIARQPGDGEYRYLRYAWKKTSGVAIVLQILSPDNKTTERVVSRPAIAYEAGEGSNKLRIPATRLAEKLPGEWEVVTRDLFADFGEFTFEGISFVPGDGDFALYDHVYLAKTLDDFSGCPARKAKPKAAAGEKVARP